MPNKHPVSFDPGKLQHKILILQQPNAVDGIGAPPQVWLTVHDCNAAIDDAYNTNKASGREFFQDGFAAARVTHVITMRWTNRVRIVPGMRAMFVDQRRSPPAVHTYYIEFVQNVEGRDVLLRLGVWEVNAPG